MGKPRGRNVREHKSQSAGSERVSMERAGRATRLRRGYGVPSIEGKKDRDLPLGLQRGPTRAKREKESAGSRWTLVLRN